MKCLLTNFSCGILYDEIKKHRDIFENKHTLFITNTGLPKFKKYL